MPREAKSSRLQSVCYRSRFIYWHRRTVATTMEVLQWTLARLRVYTARHAPMMLISTYSMVELNRCNWVIARVHCAHRTYRGYWCHPANDFTSMHGSPLFHVPGLYCSRCLCRYLSADCCGSTFRQDPDPMIHVACVNWKHITLKCSF